MVLHKQHQIVSQTNKLELHGLDCFRIITCASRAPKTKGQAISCGHGTDVVNFNALKELAVRGGIRDIAVEVEEHHYMRSKGPFKGTDKLLIL